MATPRRKVSVSECKVHGKDRWRVRWLEQEKPRRKFFISKSAADAFAANQRGDAMGVDQFWWKLSRDERERIVMVWNETQRRGLDLVGLLAEADESKVVISSPSVEKVIGEIVNTKENANRDDGYVASLRQILTKFSKGRERLPMNKVQFSDVEAFLEKYNINSRSTLRSRLSTWFKFAVRRGYCPANLCERLEHVKLVKPAPRVFTIEEVEKCLKWLKKNPRAFAWFVLTTFAGLRPEEAQKTSWKEINFKEGFIRVEAQTAKVSERRVVYPMAMTMKWLKKAKNGSVLPLTTKQLQIERNGLRKAVGLEEWPRDVTRHTAASMWLALIGDAAKVAGQLGHSEKILHRNYKAVRTRAEAEKFWAL